MRHYIIYNNFLLIAFLFLTQTIQATDSTAIVFANALQAQNNGKQQEAIQLYESLLKGNQVSSNLYNNLGLAYNSNGQLGWAIVQFERALKIDASNENAQHNLSAAQQRIKEAFGQSESIFFVRWWNGLVQSLSSTTWAIFFLLLLCLGTGAIAAWRWNKPVAYRTVGIFILVFSLFPLLWGFQQKAIETNTTHAIVIKNQVGLRPEPALSSKELEFIFEGVKVDIVEEQDSWVQVKLSNNLIGWLPMSMLERI